MHKILFAVALVSVLGPESAMAQGTVTGTVVPGTSNSRVYSFAPLQSGQFLGTLSWDNSASTLALIVVCGNADPQVFGVGSGTLDRFARVEAGLLRGQQCVIAVTSFDITAAYRLNFQFTSADPFRFSHFSLNELRRETVGPIDDRQIGRLERTLRSIADMRD